MTQKKPYRPASNAGLVKQLYTKFNISKSIPPEKVNEIESQLILWLIIFIMIIGGIMYIVADDDSLLRSFDGQDIYNQRD